MIKHIKIFGLAFGLLLLLEKCSWVVAQQPQAETATNSLVITSVSVAGKPVPLGQRAELNLGEYPEKYYICLQKLKSRKVKMVVCGSN